MHTDHRFSPPASFRADRKGRPPLRLLLLGFGNSGKSSLLSRISGTATKPGPTQGFNFVNSTLSFFRPCTAHGMWWDGMTPDLSLNQSSPLSLLCHSLTISSYYCVCAFPLQLLGTIPSSLCGTSLAVGPIAHCGGITTKGPTLSSFSLTPRMLIHYLM